MQGLTHKQAECLWFIRARIADRGVGPSFDELLQHLNLKSKSGVSRLLTALEARGAIDRVPGSARNIRLRKLTPICLHCGNGFGSEECIAAAQLNSNSASAPYAEARADSNLRRTPSSARTNPAVTP